MSLVTIDYGKLSSISSNSKKAANKMQDYIDDLTKKVSPKYSKITNGASTKTSNSEYYVNEKIKALKAKKKKYTTFATTISTFSQDASDIDKDVAKTIKASKEEFVDKHDYVDVNWWTELKEHFVDLKNKCPLFNAIGELIDDFSDWLGDTYASIKHWYKCGGGKETIGVILAVAGAIAAVVIAVCACVPPICGIVAICAAIGAVIAALNAVWNVYTSIKAKNAKDNGDPAWAKIYGEQDTVQDSLRQTNYKDGFLNKLSNYTATGIDVVQTVCDLVAIYDGVKNIQNTFKEMKKYANQSKTRNFGQIFKDYVFNKENYKGDKMRDTLQKRGKIRTLRGYKVTKAMSIDQYNKTLTKAQKFANNVTKYAKHGSNIVKYGQKFFDYTIDGKGSTEKIGKDIAKAISKKFKITDLGFKLYDLYDNNWDSFKSDYKKIRGIA